MLELVRKRVVASCVEALGSTAFAADCNTLGEPKPIHAAGP